MLNMFVGSQHVTHVVRTIFYRQYWPNKQTWWKWLFCTLVLSVVNFLGYIRNDVMTSTTFLRLGSYFFGSTLEAQLQMFPSVWPFKDVRLAIHHGGHNNNITRMVKARKLICFAWRQTVIKRIWLPVPSGNCDTEIGLAVFQQWRTQLACPLFLTAWRRQISQAVGRTEPSS